MTWKARMAVLIGSCIIATQAQSQVAETDQLAQSQLINRSAKSIRACLGRPARRIAVGDDSIWVYPIGTLTADGLPLFPLNLNTLRSGGACEVRVLFSPYGVLSIDYALPGGADLPLGQLCKFPIEPCLQPPVFK